MSDLLELAFSPTNTTPIPRQPQRPKTPSHDAAILEEVYSRLAVSPDFLVFYQAMMDKARAARSQIPVTVSTSQEVAQYNHLVGFIEGIETMFMAMKRHVDAHLQKRSGR